MHHIRPIAICVFLRNKKILVSESYDHLKDEYFYRPLGGGIEFGESSKETIRRELLEEVNLELDEESLRYLGTLENIFTYNGTPGHEIVFIYDGVLTEKDAYEHAEISGRELNGETIRAVWKSLDEFGEGKAILYPTGLLEILR